VNAAAASVLRLLPVPRRPSVPTEGVGPWRRILLVKLVGMGDGVMIRSLAEHIRRLRPDAEIGVLVGPATRDVMGLNAPFTTHLYDPAGGDRGISRFLAQVRAIRSARYDLVLDFEQHIVLVSLFLWLARIPRRVGLSAPGNPRARFQTHTIPFTGDDAMWEAYVALARAAVPGLAEPAAVPLPRAPQAIEVVARWWDDNKLGDGAAIAMHLGSGSRAAARRWPVERFAELAGRLGRQGLGGPVVLTGTPEERPLVEEFRRLHPGPVADATGLGSIERTAEVLRRCRLVVSNDTGVMHLAAAMGTATIGLFGPNTPQRYRPIGPRAAAVYTTRVPCSPCIQIHLGQVPDCTHVEKGRCLLDITVDDALAAAARILAQDAARSGS